MFEISAEYILHELSKVLEILHVEVEHIVTDVEIY